jgi:hypothetical protein
MKSSTLWLVSICLLLNLMSSCKKESSKEPTINSIYTSLHNGLVKTWTLKKLYVNGVESTLTQGQARFTKTYKVDNTWYDSDGYLGTYSVPSITTLTEATTNSTPTSQSTTYVIKGCTTTSLDIEYTQGTTTYRLVFSI